MFEKEPSNVIDLMPRLKNRRLKLKGLPILPAIDLSDKVYRPMRMLHSGPTSLMDAGFTPESMKLAIDCELGMIRSKESQKRFNQLNLLVVGLEAGFEYSTNQVATWMQSENEHLLGRTPIEFFAPGGEDIVREAALAEIAPEHQFSVPLKELTDIASLYGPHLSIVRS